MSKIFKVIETDLDGISEEVAKYTKRIEAELMADKLNAAKGGELLYEVVEE